MGIGVYLIYLLLMLYLISIKLLKAQYQQLPRGKILSPDINHLVELRRLTRCLTLK